MNSSKRKEPRGGKKPQREAEPEMTDQELRDLLAPLAEMPLLTKEDEDAAVARLQPAIRRRVKLDELKR